MLYLPPSENIGAFLEQIALQAGSLALHAIKHVIGRDGIGVCHYVLRDISVSLLDVHLVDLIDLTLRLVA
jgi:hypothetical protein